MCHCDLPAWFPKSRGRGTHWLEENITPGRASALPPRSARCPAPVAAQAGASAAPSPPRSSCPRRFRTRSAGPGTNQSARSARRGPQLLTEIWPSMCVYGGMGDMKLSVWARRQGLSYKSAWRLWKAGQLACAGQVAGHEHGDSARRASERAIRCGLVRQSFLRGPESGLGSATGPFGGVLRPARLSGGGSRAGNWLGLEWPAQSPVANIPQSERAGHVVEHRDRLMRFGLK